MRMRVTMRAMGEMRKAGGLVKGCEEGKGWHGGRGLGVLWRVGQ